MRLAAIVMLLATPFAGTGCQGDCAGVGAFAVRVTVLDFDTNAQIAAGARLSLFPADASTPIAVVTGQTDTQPLEAGPDVTGLFDVVIEKPGYFPWTAMGVEVKGSCTTETVLLTAHLRRIPPAP